MRSPQTKWLATARKKAGIALIRPIMMKKSTSSRELFTCGGSILRSCSHSIHETPEYDKEEKLNSRMLHENES